MKIIFRILCLYFCVGGAIASSMRKPDVDDVCFSVVQEYNDKYILGESFNVKLEERLKYLNGLDEICKNHDYIIVHRSKVLFDLHNYQGALEELDRGLSVVAKRKGNLLYKKASYLRMLRSSGLDTKVSYEDITNILDQASLAENDVLHLIYLVRAELAVDEKKYDEALTQIIKGIDVKNIYRFFTLGAIIAEKRGDYKMTMQMINDAVKFGGNQYLKESDTVLSLTKALCASNKQQWAKTIVSNALTASSTNQNDPVIKEAAYIADYSCR